MLIPSHRHTAADLALWAEQEDADLVHSRSASLAAKVDRSIAEIKSFAMAGPCYCGISAGKDSTVLAWLIRQAGVSVPLIHVSAGRFANPDNAAVLDRISVETVKVEYPSNAGEREKDATFYAALKSCGTRHLSGIRADESSGRKMRMQRHGLSTANACAPLGWWTAADVYALIASKVLPAHPVYAMTGGGRWPREHLRVDELGGDRGRGMGRNEWEREYYCDVLNRIAAGWR